MLSNTRGFNSFSAVLGPHRDVASKLAIVCPEVRKKGKCKLHNREEGLRRQLAKAKEEEIRKKAMAMFDTQKELLELAAEDGDATIMAELLAPLGGLAEKMQSAAAASGGGKSNSNDREELVHFYMAELKKEPAYLNWNLEAELAEQMVLQGIKHCPYAHKKEVQQTLKRSRRENEWEERRLLEEADGGKDTTSAPLVERVGPTRRVQLEEWRAQRQRTFDDLSPWQKYIVCLLWQRVCVLPQSLRLNVREELIAAVEHRFDTKATATPQSARGRVHFDGLPTFATEDEMEDYFKSAAFEARVKEEENKQVSMTFSRPEMGIVDLSSLPHIITYMNKHARDNSVVKKKTLSYFFTHGSNSSSSTTTTTTTSTADRKLELPVCSLTMKEMDVSHPARAEELVQVLEWYFHLLVNEEKLNAGSSAALRESDDGKQAHTLTLYQARRFVLRSLTLRDCDITLAEPLLTALHKHQLHLHLLALDLSRNRLHSLRFLFLLRSRYAERLLRLSLRHNIITRKPEYQEQVRQSLPRLTSLDGEPIRRPPLRLPKSLPLACAFMPTAGAGSVPITEKELRTVCDTLARLCYIFETRYVPLTALQHKQLKREQHGHEHRTAHLKKVRQDTKPEGAESALQLPDEREADEDNFPHRYFHPSATFSCLVAPGVTLYDPQTMRLDREVELDDSYQGMRLSANDVKDVRVFDVSMKNSSRNLLAGRTALQRFGRGASNCYLAYQCTLYPPRMEVDHHLDGAIVSVTKLPPPLPVASDSGRTTKGSSGALGSRRPVPAMYLVAVHGTISWRLPSMHRGECISASYDRTLIFVEKELPTQNTLWERLHSPPLVVLSDEVMVRPLAPSRAEASAARLTRLVVQFGLEACRDGSRLVAAVMERCTSDAAEEVALDGLVYGPPPLPQPTADTAAAPKEEDDDLAPWLLAAQDEMRPLLAAAAEAGEPPRGDGRGFHIFSLLDGRSHYEHHSSPAGEDGESTEKRSASWGADLHYVSMDMVNQITVIANHHCTCKLRK